MPFLAHKSAKLQDFERPPLNEVVLGVQFSNPVGYQQIHAGEVWNLFREEYPKVQEHMALAPVFETFGTNALSGLGNQIAFLDGAVHDRFWFLRPDGSELIQFQQDRLLHNWRKLDDGSNSYPNFETIFPKFQGELQLLQGYMQSLHPQSLAVNQCEISYINHIQVEQGEAFKVADWLKFVNFDANSPQSFSFGMREIVRNAKGEPQGRLICEATEGVKANGQRIIALTLTLRGAPATPDIDSALEFISTGHDLIVNRFVELTTSSAQKVWGYMK